MAAAVMSRRKAAPPTVRALASQSYQRSASGHLIGLHGVVKSFTDRKSGQERGVKGLSFTVSPGEFVFLTGPTGSGKTTALRLMRGQSKPDSGRITLGGRDIATIDRRALLRSVGLVSQTLDTLPMLTVAENISYPLECLRQDPREIRERTRELVELFGLRHAAHRLCDEQELSGGERQRLAIARALAPRPDLLLCDEPTGNLDERTTYGVMRTLNRVSMLGTTIICVTHDPQIVNLMRKRVIVIRDGRAVSDSVGGYAL